MVCADAYQRSIFKSLYTVGMLIGSWYLAASGTCTHTVVCVANGMRLLSEDGWFKVRKGITTPEEILRVTAA